MDAWFSLVFVNAFVKLVAEQLSKKLAGNDVNLVQPYHADWKLVPLLTSNSGNDVNLVQPYHA